MRFRPTGGSRDQKQPCNIYYKCIDYRYSVPSQGLQWLAAAYSSWEGLSEAEVVLMDAETESRTVSQGRMCLSMSIVHRQLRHCLLARPTAPNTSLLVDKA